jgi:integrase/recombinase XerC
LKQNISYFFIVKNNFLQHIEKEKRQSHNTLTAYKTDLTQFENYLSNNFHNNDITTANHQFIRSWLVSLIEEGINPRSVRRKISALNAFYNYLIREKCISSSPMQKIISPKFNHKLPVFLNEKQMTKVLSSETTENTFECARKKIIINLFYSTGLRRFELINLKTDDFNTRRKTLKIIGKGNKERVVPITDDLANHLQHYLIHRDKYLADHHAENKYLIITGKCKQAYPKMIYNIVRSELTPVSTASKKSPHVLRHTFATTMLNSGAGLNAIKEFLGHSNLTATQIYTHNTIEKLQTIYKQAHPRA